MSAVIFRPGVYYRHLCAPDQLILFKVSDVENYPTCVTLRNNAIVLCKAIVFRKGGQGRGLYAKLLSHRGFAPLRSGSVATVYLRVSRNNIGSGNWEEANEMEVLARADSLPII